MELKVFFTVFAAVFIAELGDKTQFATMLFAADKEVSKWTVFWGASAALIVATAIGVISGTASLRVHQREISQLHCWSRIYPYWSAYIGARLRLLSPAENDHRSFFKIRFSCTATVSIASTTDLTLEDRIQHPAAGIINQKVCDQCA